jgi:alpha-N-arabinofuranosidase
MQKVDSSHVAKNDPNKFGTNEFIRFCKLIGTEPYLAGNVRSLTAGDFYQWIEYCNSPSGSTLAERRAANGDAAPFDVRFWGVGNESWGCGGDMTPEEYSVEFRKFTSWVPQYGKPLSYIASGPNGFDYGWSRRFFERLTEKSPRLINRVWGWALHYYCGKTGKGDSLDYTTQDYYELLDRANRMEELIEKHWAVMAEFDKEHRVKLAIDEWGAWHNDGTAVAPHHLFGSVPTMRDALIAGLTLDTFQRHAEKVSMANVAQLVNCIQTLFLAHEDKFCVTPTYHVFAMYKDHHDGQAVRSLFDAPRIEYALGEKKSQVVRMAGSASMNGRRLTLTAVNNGHADAVDTMIRVDGAKVNSASAVVLAAPDVHAHNHFDRPEEVRPRAES